MNPGHGREGMEFRIVAAEDVFYLDLKDCKGVPDQGTVATPGHCFGAHDSRRLLGAQLDQFLQGFLKLWGLHIVGEATKRRVSPAHIG